MAVPAPNNYLLADSTGSQALPTLEVVPLSEGAAATATSESPAFSPHFLRILYLFRPLSPPPVLWEEQQRVRYSFPDIRSFRYVKARQLRDTSPLTHRGRRHPPDSSLAVYVEGQRLGRPARHGKNAVHFTAVRPLERRIYEGQTIWLQGNLWDYWMVVKKDGEHGPYSLMEIIQGYHRLRTHVAILHQYVELAWTLDNEPTEHPWNPRRSVWSRELPPLYGTETEDPSPYRIPR